jgi:hypothetical protein
VAAAIAVEPAARVTREPNENGSNSKAVGWAPFLARPDEVEATRQFKTRVESVPSEKPEKSPK